MAAPVSEACLDSWACVLNDKSYIVRTTAVAMLGTAEALALVQHVA